MMARGGSRGLSLIGISCLTQMVRHGRKEGSSSSAANEFRIGQWVRAAVRHAGAAKE